MIVKRIFIPLTLSLMMGAALPAMADHQSGCCVKSVADTVKITEYTDGDYLVRKYLVRKACDAGFDVHYRINLSEVNSSFDNNAQELDALWNFISRVGKEEGAQLRSVRIVGYASPDGIHNANARLAHRRAEEFKSYLESKSCPSECCRVEMSSQVADWKSCCPMVEQSQMPDKQRVLEILSGGCSEQQKECALKRMPRAWEYLAREVLPVQRRVEVDVAFTKNDETVSRTLINKRPAPEVTPTPQPQPQVEEQVVVVEQQLTRKEQRALRREARRAEREARRVARREAKDARRLAKDAERMVRDAQ